MARKMGKSKEQISKFGLNLVEWLIDKQNNGKH